MRLTVAASHTPNMDPDAARDDDAMSDYASSVTTSDFTSINSSRLQAIHQYAHGRRYQAFLQGRYGMPNDDAEQIREGVKHRLFLDYILNGKLIIAPIGDNPQKICDLGTGVGFWALDVAEAFPGARIIGTDLSPIQPHWLPPNCEFRVEDLEDDQRPWTNIYRGSDLIHSRAFLQTLRQPKRLVQRIFENLKPGGWYQGHEGLPAVYDENGNLWPEHRMNRLYELLQGQFTATYGWNLLIAYETRNLLEETGFTNIHEQIVDVPLGRWPSTPRMREMGLFNLSVAEDFATTMLARHESVGLTEEGADELARGIVADLHDLRLHAHLKYVNFYAQRPPS